MVFGSLDVSNSLVSRYSTSFVSQSGWWCSALWMSPIHLSPVTALHLSPSLAGGVRLSGCLQFTCFPLQHFICLPVWLVVSGSLDVCFHLSPFIGFPLWLVVSGSLDVCFHLSPFIGFPLWLVVSGDASLSICFPYCFGVSGFGCLFSLDSLYLPPFAYCVWLASAVSPSLSPSLSPPVCSHAVSPNFCLFWQGTLWSSSCLPQLPIIYSCLRRHPMVSQWSPNCLQLSPSCRADMISQLSSRSLPDVVSQMLSPSGLQGFSICCLIVFRLSPHVVSRLRQGFYTCYIVFYLLSSIAPVSQIWSPSCLPRCGSQMLSPSPVVVLLSSTSLPDVVCQLSSRCGFLDVS